MVVVPSASALSAMRNCWETFTTAKLLMLEMSMIDTESFVASGAVECVGNITVSPGSVCSFVSGVFAP